MAGFRQCRPLGASELRQFHSTAREILNAWSINWSAASTIIVDEPRLLSLAPLPEAWPWYRLSDGLWLGHSTGFETALFSFSMALSREESHQAGGEMLSRLAKSMGDDLAFRLAGSNSGFTESAKKTSDQLAGLHPASSAQLIIRNGSIALASILVTADYFPTQADKQTPISIDQVQESILECEMSLEVSAGGARISLSELINLDIGDLLVLQPKQNSLVHLRTEKNRLPIAMGLLCCKDEKLAIQLLEIDKNQN